MLFLDPSYVSYTIINTKTFCFSENRYGAFITQMFPLAGAWLNLPLGFIMITYSASFFLFYLIAGFVVWKYLKQPILVILFALYLSLFVSDVFFWPNNEVHQGIGWMILFLGLFLYYNNAGNSRIKWYHHFLLIALAVLAIFNHFIVIIPLSFFWIYYFLESWHERKTGNLWKFFIYTGILLLIFIIKYRVNSSSSYDGYKLEPLKNISVQSVLSAFSSGHAKTFFSFLFRNYWLVIPLFLTGLFRIIKSRRYFLALLVCGYVTGYFLLVCMIFPDAFGRDLLFYMESEWMALSMIAVAPFVFHVIPAMSRQMSVAVMAGIFAVRLFYIFNAYPDFRQRYERMELITDRLKEQGISKAVIQLDSEKRKEYFRMDWATSSESMMISNLKGYEPHVTFKVVTEDFRPLDDPAIIYSPFSSVYAGTLNQKYFRPDSTEIYKIFTEQEFFELIR